MAQRNAATQAPGNQLGIGVVEGKSTASMAPRLSLCCPSEILMGLCRLPPLALSFASVVMLADLIRTFGDTMAVVRASFTCKSGDSRHGEV